MLALCMASGLQPKTAVELANVAAGIVVGKVGTVPVEKHELLAALSPQIALHGEDKVVAREDVAIDKNDAGWNSAWRERRRIFGLRQRTGGGESSTVAVESKNLYRKYRTSAQRGNKQRRNTGILPLRQAQGQNDKS